MLRLSKNWDTLEDIVLTLIQTNSLFKTERQIGHIATESSIQKFS